MQAAVDVPRVIGPEATGRTVAEGRNHKGVEGVRFVGRGYAWNAGGGHATV